jgi:hypothetical protein
MKKPVDEFIITEAVSDLPLKPRGKDRDIETELFGQKKVKEVIDAFEETIGIKNKHVKAPNVVYKNILLSPGYDEEDRALYNDLLNDIELYRIVKISESWTNRGDFKIFIVYTEDQDVKQQRIEEKDKHE